MSRATAGSTNDTNRLPLSPGFNEELLVHADATVFAQQPVSMLRRYRPDTRAFVARVEQSSTRSESDIAWRDGVLAALSGASHESGIPG